MTGSQKEAGFESQARCAEGGSVCAERGSAGGVGWRSLGRLEAVQPTLARADRQPYGICTRLSDRGTEIRRASTLSVVTASNRPMIRISVPPIRVSRRARSQHPRRRGAEQIRRVRRHLSEPRHPDSRDDEAAKEQARVTEPGASAAVQPSHWRSPAASPAGTRAPTGGPMSNRSSRSERCLIPRNISAP